MKVVEREGEGEDTKTKKTVKQILRKRKYKVNEKVRDVEKEWGEIAHIVNCHQQQLSFFLSLQKYSRQKFLWANLEKKRKVYDGFLIDMPKPFFSFFLIFLWPALSPLSLSRERMRLSGPTFSRFFLTQNLRSDSSRAPTKQANHPGFHGGASPIPSSCSAWLRWVRPTS